MPPALWGHGGRLWAEANKPRGDIISIHLASSPVRLDVRFESSAGGWWVLARLPCCRTFGQFSPSGYGAKWASRVPGYRGTFCPLSRSNVGVGDDADNHTFDIHASFLSVVILIFGNQFKTADAQTHSKRTKAAVACGKLEANNVFECIRKSQDKLPPRCVQGRIAL
jgi:hypothetical protein